MLDSGINFLLEDLFVFKVAGIIELSKDSLEKELASEKLPKFEDISLLSILVVEYEVSFSLFL